MVEGMECKTRLINSFAELREVVSRLEKERKAKWLKHYLLSYINSIHSVVNRLEYTYRLQHLLVKIIEVQVDFIILFGER